MLTEWCFSHRCLASNTSWSKSTFKPVLTKSPSFLPSARSARCRHWKMTASIPVFGAGFNADEVIGRAHALLGKLEQHLADRDWLAADHPTIADVAIYSYIARAPEGNVELSAYPAVNRLLRRIEALPGFVPFAQTPAGLTAKA